MATYTPYPKSKDTPNRRSRKGSRNTTFQFNRKANKVAKETK